MVEKTWQREHGGRSRRVAGHIAATLRKQRVNGKWDGAMKLQGSPPVVYFFQGGSTP